MLKSFKLLLCCCALIMCGNMALAQNTPRNCGSMDYLEEQIRQDPKRLQKMQTIEDFTTRYASQRSGTALVTIPVVVHVVYNTTAENISVAQIQSQIDVLNKDFRRLNADANNTWPQAADVQIEFCLATIDPSGNSTTGITRTATSKTSFGTNDQVKYNSLGGKDAWPSGSYLNIWVCDISNGILGYAQFPGGAAATDGVVIDYQYFGTTGTATAPFNLGRTATHEVGHWLNLRHIWGDGGCSVDDNVSDTPLSDAANYGCAVGHVSCSTVDMVQNYMDYSDDACMNLFTAGQKTRMQALFAPGGFRYSLLSSQGCGGTPPTCTDGVQNGQETGVDCGGPTCPACVCTANVVTITIKLDNYPEETSWTLSNAQGTVAAGGTYGSLADGSTVAVPLCLANGCYNFTISDAYGDGICCNYGQGSYSVTDASGTVLVSGSSFGASETKSFCLSDSPAATCTDGIQNQGETGIDCGGPCTACVSCTDGIQNQGETGVDCGGPCSACATCTDGIQNQGETGVDCGGPCAPCACVYTTINFNNFDSGLGIWTDGGTDCALVSSATYANSGTNSVQLRDNTNTSVMTTSNLNLGEYTEVKIDFSYICVSMDRSTEDFWLQVSTNGGSTYTTVASWNLNDEFVNNVRYNPSVTLTGTFTSTTRFRFRCDASADDDLVYIDDVRITGCGLAGGRTENAVDIDGLVADEPQLGNLELYPNPTNSLLNVKFSSNAETTANLRVMDMSGKVWQEQTINGTNGVQEQVLDISTLAPGVYFISIDSNKNRLIQRFVVVE